MTERSIQDDRISGVLVAAAVSAGDCRDGANLITLAGLRAGLPPGEVGRLTAAFECCFDDLVRCLGRGKVTVSREGIVEPRLRVAFRSAEPGTAPDQAQLLERLDGFVASVEIDRSEPEWDSVVAWVALPHTSRARDDETEPDLPSGLAAQPKRVVS